MTTYCNGTTGQDPRTRTIKVCEGCGAEFYNDRLAPPSVWLKRRFCNRDCYNATANFALNGVFTPDQDAVLREFYPEGGAVVVAEKLGKTLQQCYRRAHRLGVRKGEVPVVDGPWPDPDPTVEVIYARAKLVREGKL